MIFSGELYEAVLWGRKTVTRRLNCPYRVGRDYAIVPRRTAPGHPVKRILITGVRREMLAWACDEAEVRREGFGSVDAFVARWRQLNRVWDPTLMVYRIEFEVIAR